MALSVTAPASAAPPLSSAHRALDNDSKCDKCHEDGDTSVVPNKKCLVCHKEIAVRLARGKGFHARVAGQQCRKCHKEHRGRGANIIPLNIAKFDHNKTGWPLQGRHEKVRCQNCHTGTRRGGRTRTYLGLSPNCNNCHKNIHGFTRSSLKKCDRCHNVFGWRKINANSNFNHNKETSYALEGGHARVNCRKCHMGRDRFAPLAHANCTDCHKDEHRGLFNPRKCEQCHSATTWNKVKFAHNIKRFRLTGAHRRVRCKKCHTTKNWQPPWKPPSNRCNNCHRKDNAHGNQFKGKNCNACHTTVNWKKLDFNHNRQSRFKLVGKHQRVACGKCHPGGRYKPLDTACVACHADDDPHQGKFADKPCDNCHSPRDWNKVRFDHTVTRFELKGAHSDVDCEKCHPGGDLKRNIPSSCDGCHIDLHNGQFKDKLCGNCHTFDSWPIENFPHNDIARFKLVGRHQEVDCDKCHVAGHFKPIQANCETCHRDFHAGQMKDKVCEQCHAPLGWQQVEFVHNRDSDYKLIGKHVTLDCKKCHVENNYRGLEQKCAGCHLDEHKGAKGKRCNNCHTESSWDTNTEQVHFFGSYLLGGEHDRLPCSTCHTGGKPLGGLGHECLNCHRDPHFSSFGPFCIDCHSQRAWLPSRFRHFQTGFRLTGQHRFVNCDKCHVNRIYGGLPTNCEFCHTDTVMRLVGSSRGAFHNCLVTDCQNCHTTRGWVPVRRAFRDVDCRMGVP